MNKKVKKWSNWLNVIGVQIQNMLIKKDTHNTILKIISNNKHLHQHNPFYDHLFHTYIAYISVSVRRQLKRNNNSISLYGLLSDMSENKSNIPKHEYITIDPDADIERIKQSSKYIEEYVDRRLAHTDKRAVKVLPNPNEIEECIILLKDIHKNYNSVINNADVELMPVRNDWTNIFTYPWINNNIDKS